MELQTIRYLQYRFVWGIRLNLIAIRNNKGVAVKPVPKVKIRKNNLKLGRDFKVSYLRNGVKGEAEVIITGIGNYTGECRQTFVVQ